MSRRTQCNGKSVKRHFQRFSFKSACRNFKCEITDCDFCKDRNFRELLVWTAMNRCRWITEMPMTKSRSMLELEKRCRNLKQIFDSYFRRSSFILFDVNSSTLSRVHVLFLYRHWVYWLIASTSWWNFVLIRAYPHLKYIAGTLVDRGFDSA